MEGFEQGEKDHVRYLNSTDAAIDAGDVGVLEDAQVGLAFTDIAVDGTGVVRTRGMFEFTKATGSGTALAAGQKVYWDASAAKVTPVQGQNAFIGRAFEASSTTDTLAWVLLGEFASDTGRYAASSAETLTLAAREFFGGELTLLTSHAAPTITLPPVADIPVGARLNVASTGTTTLDGNSSENVNGATTDVLFPGTTGTYVNNGTAWILVGIRPTDPNASNVTNSGSTVTLAASDFAKGSHVVFASANGTQTVNVPAGSSVAPGTRLLVKKTGTAGDITMAAASGTITAVDVDAQGDFCAYYSDGTNWIAGEFLLL